jgi:hypothetical protein
MINNVRCTCELSQWPATRGYATAAPSKSASKSESASVGQNHSSGTTSGWNCRVEARWHAGLGEANDALQRGLVDQVTLGGGAIVAYVRAARSGVGSTRQEAIDDCLLQFDRDGLTYVADAVWASGGNGCGSYDAAAVRPGVVSRWRAVWQRRLRSLRGGPTSRWA